MRKIVNILTIGKVAPLGFIALLMIFAGLSMSATSSRAEDWGPYLGPAFPEESDDDSYRPNSITMNKGKQLPLPSKKRASQSFNRQAGFDDMPSPHETIIPQRLLVDDTASETVPIPALPNPKMPKKKPQADLLNSASIPAPLTADIPLNEGEFIVDENNAGLLANIADVSEPYGGLYDGGTTSGGLYNEMSPALAGNYFGPVMIKPFGTGMLDNVTIFSGTTGFKNELDAGRNGNFGFTEGINWAGPATPQCTVSGQVGFRAVQSNLSGSSYSQRNRNQYFVTAGFFKRELTCPIQGGAVLDWFQDDFYGKVSGQQIRYELSARTFSNTEYGIVGAFGLSKKGNEYLDAYFNNALERFNYGVKPQQYYLLFLRKHFVSGGVAEFRGGVTAHGDTVLAALGEVPLCDRFTINSCFSTLIPKQGHANTGSVRESWEISVGVTFYFRGGACSKPANPCRPMFEVAGNGSFFNRIVRK